MGKVKRKKNKKQRTNPISGATPCVDSLDDEVRENGANSEISPYIETILEQLKSHSVEERDSGLNSISSGCSNPSLLDQFLKHDVVKIVCTLLIDKSPIVRHASAGALRNISTIGTAVCSLMISQGIMPPLVTLFKQNYSAEWKPKYLSYPVSSFKIDTVMETFIEAVNLLWNLCESSGTALKVFNEEGLAQILIRCLNPKEYGLRIPIAVGQCLNTVTEDNIEVISNMGEFEILLQKILSSVNETSDSGSNYTNETDWLYLQILACGILLNLGEQVTKQSTANLSLTMKTISEILLIDHLQILKTFTSEIPLRNGQNLMETDQNGRDNTTSDTTVENIHSLEISSSNISNLLNGQILALEIMSNILFADSDKEDADLDNDSDSDEDELTEVERMEEDDDVNDVSWTSIVPEVYEGIISKQLLDRIVDKIREPPINVSQILLESQEYGSIGKTIRNLRCRALLCFQNLVHGLDINDLGGFDRVKEIWVFLSQLLKQEAANEDIKEGDLIEAITSAIRSLALKLVDEKEKYSDIVGVLTVTDFSNFCNIYNKVTIAKIHANIIKIIGGIGILISWKKNENIAVGEIELMLEHVGGFLLNCISNYGDSQHLWRVSEALDTIFDVFAEDDYNHVLKKLCLIEKLKIFLPQFKRNIKNERRRLGENRAIIETSRTNLSRFIEYKVKNGCP